MRWNRPKKRRRDRIFLVLSLSLSLSLPSSSFFYDAAKATRKIDPRICAGKEPVFAPKRHLRNFHGVFCRVLLLAWRVSFKAEGERI